MPDARQPGQKGFVSEGRENSRPAPFGSFQFTADLYQRALTRLGGWVSWNLLLFKWFLAQMLHLTTVRSFCCHTHTLQTASGRDKAPTQ